MTIYADTPEQLSPAQRAAIEAHLDVCGACRRRLLTSNDVGRLLRTHLPTPQPTPERITAILDAIEQRTATDIEAGKPYPTTFRRSRRVIISAAVVLVLVIGTTVTAASYSWDISPLSRVVTLFDEDEHNPDVRGDQTASAAYLSKSGANSLDDMEHLESLGFTPVALSQLPGKFQLTSTVIEGDERLELHYLRDDGLELRLVESPAGAFDIAVPLERYHMHYVDDLEVLMLPESFGSIEHLVWEHNGVAFDLLVLRSSESRNLSLPEVEHIVEDIAAASAS